jgi:hypothetical protein
MPISWSCISGDTTPLTPTYGCGRASKLFMMGLHQDISVISSRGHCLVKLSAKFSG